MTTRTRSRRYQPVLDLPPLSTDEEAGLRASIALHGVLVPILLTEDGRIIDGNNRKRFTADRALYRINLDSCGVPLLRQVARQLGYTSVKVFLVASPGTSPPSIRLGSCKAGRLATFPLKHQ